MWYESSDVVCSQSTWVRNAELSLQSSDTEVGGMLRTCSKHKVIKALGYHLEGTGTGPVEWVKFSQADCENKVSPFCSHLVSFLHLHYVVTEPEDPHQDTGIISNFLNAKPNKLLLSYVSCSNKNHMNPHEMNKLLLKETPKSYDKRYNKYGKRGNFKSINEINQSKKSLIIIDK